MLWHVTLGFLIPHVSCCKEMQLLTPSKYGLSSLQTARELACGRAASGLFRSSIWIKHCADAFEAAVQRNCDTKLLSFHNSTSIEVQNKVIRNRILQHKQRLQLNTKSWNAMQYSNLGRRKLDTKRILFCSERLLAMTYGTPRWIRAASTNQIVSVSGG